MTEQLASTSTVPQSYVKNPLGWLKFFSNIVIKLTVLGCMQICGCTSLHKLTDIVKILAQYTCKFYLFSLAQEGRALAIKIPETRLILYNGSVADWLRDLIVGVPCMMCTVWVGMQY